MSEIPIVTTPEVAAPAPAPEPQQVVPGRPYWHLPVSLILATVVFTIIWALVRQHMYLGGPEEFVTPPMYPTEDLATTPNNRLPLVNEGDIFSLVNKEYLQIEQDATYPVDDQYRVVSTLTSPDKKKIAFAEISQCFTKELVDCLEESNYTQGKTCASCDYNFRLRIHDYATNKTLTAYDYLRDGSIERSEQGQETSWLQKRIPVAYAGVGATEIPFPKGWTQDSSTLIAEAQIFKSSPTGAYKMPFFLFTAETGNYKKIPNLVYGFTHDFQYVVTLNVSKENQSWLQCPFGNSKVGDQIRVLALPSLQTVASLDGKFFVLNSIADYGGVEYLSTDLLSAEKYAQSPQMGALGCEENFDSLPLQKQVLTW